MSSERPVILDPPADDPYRYRVRWFDHVGRKRQRSFRGTDEKTARAARKKALAFVDDLVAKIQRGERTTTSKITIEQAFDEWWPVVCARISESTANGSYGPAFEHRILPFMGSAAIGSIDGETIDKFVAWMARRGAGPHTMKNTITALSSLLQTMVEWRRIPYNACRGAKLPKIPDADRQAYDMDIVYDIAAGMRFDRDRALVVCAAWMGQRKSDIYELRWDNVDTGPLDLPEGYRPSFRVWRKKPQKWDVVPLFETARLALIWWREVTPLPDGLVFPSSTGTSLGKQSSAWYRRQWRPACVRAGLMRCANASCRQRVEATEDAAQRIAIDPAGGAKKLAEWRRRSKLYAEGNGPKPRGVQPLEPWACSACGCGDALGPVFHELRHTFGSHAVYATGDMAQVARWGGWSGTAMLERRYNHELGAGQAQAVDAMNRMGRL